MQSTRNSKVDLNSNFTTSKINLNSILQTLSSVMGITLPEAQSGTLLRLDPSCAESNRSFMDWSILDSLEYNLLKPVAEMDLGDDPALDFMLDQDVGSVTLCDFSWPPVCNLASYKRMPNFGGSETGLSQPLLSVLEECMEIEEVSRTDSPPSWLLFWLLAANRTPLLPQRCVPPALAALTANRSSSSSPPGRSRASYTMTTPQA